MFQINWAKLQEELQKRQQEENNTSASPQTRLPTGGVADSSPYDNEITAKLRARLTPYVQAQQGNKTYAADWFKGARDNGGMVENRYAPGTVLHDAYEVGRTGRANFQLASASSMRDRWDTWVKMGINDPYVAMAARNKAYNNVADAIDAGKRDAPYNYDLYADRNAGKGYSAFGGNAGEVDKFGLAYESVRAAEVTKLNRKEGRKDNEDTLRAKDYASLSDKYIDDMIPKLEDHVAKLRAEKMDQAVKGELMTTQMLLDGLKQEKKDRAALVDLTAEYAQGDSAADWGSMVEVDEKGTDIVDKMLYMNLIHTQRKYWDDEENEWTRQIAEEMGGSIPAWNDYSDEGYHLMTADEIALVNKVWNTTHDPIKTQEVLDAMASKLRTRRMSYDENLWAYKSDAYGDLMTDLASIPMQGYANLEGAVNAFQGMLGNEDVKDVNSGEWRTQGAVNAIRGWTGEKAYNSGGAGAKFLHDTGLAIGDEALKFLPSLAFGPGAQQAMSAIAGFSQGTYGAYERGVDNPFVAAAEGAVSAGIEALTENLGLDVPNTSAVRGSRHLLRNMASEGLEEGISELLGLFAGEAIADLTGTYSANDLVYMDELINSKETDRTKRHLAAQSAVADQNREGVLYSTAVGGAVGGALSAPSAAGVSIQQRRRGSTVSRNNNVGSLLEVAMSMTEGSEARQMAETFSEQAKKGKKLSNGQLGRLYAATAMDLDAQSAAVVTETMNDAIVELMVDKGETEEAARRAAPILAKQLRGEKLTDADTSALAESKTAITMMEELNKYTEGGKEDGPKTGLFKRTAKGTQVTNEQIQEAENLLLEKGDSAKAAKRAAPLLARAVNGDTLTKAEQAELAQIPGGEETVAQLRDAETQRKELLKPAWVKDAESSQQAKEQQRATDIISKGRALLKTTMPSSNTAIQKSAEKAKTLTEKSGAETGVRNTTATPLGSKESVDIQRVEAGEDGVLRLRVKNADGTEKSMSYQQLSFKSESMGHVITHAIDNAAGNAELANLMVQGYTGGDSTEYLAQFDTAYRAGYDNAAVNVQSMTSFSKGISKEAFKLGQKQAQEAEQTRLKNIGKGMTGNGSVTIPDGVDVNRLSKPQRRQVAVVRTIAKATGINFTFYQSAADDSGVYRAENGSYDAATNSIRIDLNAGKNYRGDVAEYAILRTAAHEMTHFIEANSRENYAKMRQFIADELARKGIDFNARVQEKIDRSPVPLTRAGAIAEVVADGCEMMLQDSQAVQRLLQKDESLAGQIKQVLSDFADRIRKAFEGIRPGSKDAEALLEERDGLLHYADELQKLWDAGLEEAVEATKGDAETAVNTATIPTTVQFELRAPAPATTRDYLLSLPDADLTTEGQKDAMRRYRAYVDELRGLEEQRATQEELAQTTTGDAQLAAKARAGNLTKQADRLRDKLHGMENSNVFRPLAAEARAVLEANRQLDIGRPVETVIKGMGGKVRNAEKKLIRFRQQMQEDRNTREKITATRRRITKMVKYLDTLRRKESDYKHVPEELKPTVNALVAAFAEHSSMVFDSRRAERIAQAYSKLQALDNDLAAFYDPDIQEKIEYIAALMELKRGKPMKLAEVEIIEDVVGSIYKMVRGSNEAFFENQMMDIVQIAADVADEMLARQDKTYRVGSKLEDGLNTLIVSGNLTPVYYFDNLGNEMLKRLGYDIMNGQDKYGLYQRDDRNTMGEIRRKYHYNDWKNDKPIVHNDVQFTKEQALWVYATAKREATNELAQTHHLDEGGIVFEGGMVVGADGKKRKVTTPMRLSAKDVQAITSTLTEEQKGYADAVVRHLSTTVGDRGNEVSMRMYGFRKYREQYYFPYKTAGDQRHQTSVSNAVSATNDARLKHQSFSNPLKKGANTPLVIGDFTKMATSHMNAMNTYAAMVIPVENMNRVLNRKTDVNGATTTIRALMAQKYGDPTKTYLETLLKDLNGGAQVDNRTGGWIDKTVGLYKKGAVVASASVLLQQWTSIFRAAYMINPKYLLTSTFQKRDWDELVKYSGVATIKAMGRFDVSVGVGGSNWLAADADDFTLWEKARQMMKPTDWETFKTRWDDAINFLPGYADQITWAHIWNAVKAEQAERNPGMDTSSDAFLKQCAERFNDVINHTQVYDSTMTRSQLMRSKNALDKMMTAFGAEPTIIINMVYDAMHNPAYKGKRKLMIASSIATVTMSQLFVAAMQALASAWRKDDDERKALEKFIDKWSYNFADNMNPFTLFPYVRDVWDTLFSKYEVERSDMTLFSELKNAISKWNNDSYSPYRKVEEIAGTVAKFFGLPLKNVMRDFRSLYNAINSDWTAPNATSLGYAVLDNIPLRPNNTTSYYKRMENAYAAGDEGKAEDILQYLDGKGTSADAIKTGMGKMLKHMLADDNDAGVEAILADMAERGNERDGGDLQTVITDLYKGGEITWQQAERLYKKYTSLTNANDLYWQKEKLDYKGEGNYNAYRAAREALLAGDKKTYLAEKSKLLTHGKKGPNVMSETVTDLKDELLALYETDPAEARKLREMIVWAYMECGKTKQSANKTIDGWFKD